MIIIFLRIYTIEKISISKIFLRSNSLTLHLLWGIFGPCFVLFHQCTLIPFPVLGRPLRYPFWNPVTFNLLQMFKLSQSTTLITLCWTFIFELIFRFLIFVLSSFPRSSPEKIHIHSY